MDLKGELGQGFLARERGEGGQNGLSIGGCFHLGHVLGLFNGLVLHLYILLLQEVISLSLLLLCETGAVLAGGEGGDPEREIYLLIVPVYLGCNQRMHLTENNSCTLPSHINWSHAVLHTVCSVRVFCHHTDTPSGERDHKSTITEPIKLAAKRKSGI